MIFIWWFYKIMRYFKIFLRDVSLLIHSLLFLPSRFTLIFKIVGGTFYVVESPMLQGSKPSLALLHRMFLRVDVGLCRTSVLCFFILREILAQRPLVYDIVILPANWSLYFTNLWPSPIEIPRRHWITLMLPKHGQHPMARENTEKLRKEVGHLSEHVLNDK